MRIYGVNKLAQPEEEQYRKIFIPSNKLIYNCE